jgi:hypothetical protein
MAPASILLVLAIGCSSKDKPTGDAGAMDANNADGTADTGAGDGGPTDGSPTDSSSTDGEGGAGEGGEGGSCSAARQQALMPIDQVANTNITVLATDGAVKTIFIDATAGGVQMESANPYIYVNLGTATKVSVTDVTAGASTAWDLAIKRPGLFTNSGDGGPGMGGAVFIQKAFDTVTMADATGAAFATEKFLDANCQELQDPTLAVLTTFSGWYNYDMAAQHMVTPMTGTFLVKGGSGTLYKLEILDFYATPDGGTGDAGGRYTMKVAAL